MKIKSLFTSGKMNKDLDERLVPKGEYRDALNVRIANSKGSDVGAVENALSNSALSSLSLGSNATCIGVVSDDKNNQIYWFVKSDAGSYILEYSADSGSTEFVIRDTRPDETNVLNFSKGYVITGVNIIIDAEKDKKYIYWTDGLNPPRKIEVSIAKNYSVNGFSDSDISVIKAPPRKEPRIVGVEGDNLEESNMRDDFFSFTYRYVYEDDQTSALSPFSDFAFKPGVSDTDSTDNPSMINRFTSVNVFVNTGDKTVKKVEVYAKKSSSQNTYLIHTIDKDKTPYGNNVEIPYLFKNDKLFTVLSETQFNRVYDNVPIRAYAQDVIGNRLVYGNYEENYDLLDADNNSISFNLSIEKRSSVLSEACETSSSYTITRVGSVGLFYYTNCDGESVEVKLDQGESITICGYNLGNVVSNPAQYTKVDNGSCGKYIGEPTLRSNRTYDVGMVYYDSYGRKSTVITGLSNSININHFDNDTKNQLVASVSHKPPYWADRYKFAVKQNSLEYYTMRTKGPFYRAKEDNVDYYYIKFSQTELNKAANGDLLILKNNGSSSMETLYRYEVIGVENKDADFIGVGTQEAGVYMKIKGVNTILSDTLSEPYMIVFERTQKIASDSAYYEVPGTFDIIDGLHNGSTQNQTSSQPAVVELNAYNAYCFGDGSESNRINDSISGEKLELGVRVSEEIDDYKAISRKASLTYSDVIDTSTSYNGLNQFNLSLANYKDMDPSYGDIKLIKSRDSDLITFQENKVHRVLFNKSVIYNADGTGNVSQNINVLGQEVPYQGEYGISRSPQSFQSWGYDMFFADERRGAICRLSENGITDISNYGMRGWFNDNLKVGKEHSVVGGYDPINDHYVVSIKEVQPEWREDTYECAQASTTTTTTAPVITWVEDTYECVQDSTTTTTTTTTEEPTTTTTTTTTAEPSTTTTTTTTTAAPTFYGYQVAYDEFNELTACSIAVAETTVYSLCNPITLPGEGMCYLYNTPNVNDPVAGGYYHDTTPSGGVTKYYYTEGSNGLVQEIGTCPSEVTTTTTMPQCQSVASSVQYSVQTGICGVTPNEITLYYTGNDPNMPQVGDTAYREVGCTGGFVPAGYYRIGTTGDFWIQIQSNGYVGQVVECIE